MIWAFVLAGLSLVAIDTGSNLIALRAAKARHEVGPTAAPLSAEGIVAGTSMPALPATNDSSSMTNLALPGD